MGEVEACGWEVEPETFGVAYHGWGLVGAVGGSGRCHGYYCGGVGAVLEVE